MENAYPSSNTSALNQDATIRLQTLVAIGFSVLAIVAIAIVTTVLFFNFRNEIREDVRQRLRNMVSIAALQQDGDLHAEIQNPGDENSEAYQAIKGNNFAILATDPDIAYIYTMRSDEQGNIYFVVDTGPPGADTAAALEPYPDAGEALAANFVLLEETIAEVDPYTDEFGTFYSAYAPFYRSDGTREGVIGMDIRVDTVLAREQTFLMTTIGVALLLIPFVALAGVWVASLITKPLVNLTIFAQQVAQGNLNLRAKVEANSFEVQELEKYLNNMTSQLQKTILELEDRVAERTAELEEANQRTERRARQLKTISDLFTTISTVQELRFLLPRIAELISERFGFYHVGLFLLDTNNEYAVFSGTNSQGGYKMLERGHRLRVGQEGIVGYVADAGEPRIASDTGSDAVFFNNPDLPQTRAEAALPLKFGDQIIGVLDIQSTETDVFTEDNVEVLSVLASQVAIAIANVRAQEGSRRLVEQTQSLNQEYTSTSWRNLTQRREQVGIRYTGAALERLDKPVITPQIQKAAQAGNVETSKTDLALPITLRGKVIGTINVRVPGGRDWTTDEKDILQSVSDRIALALENARLLEEAQITAGQERALAEMSNKIGSSFRFESILRTAAEELSRVLSGSEVLVQIALPAANKDEK